MTDAARLGASISEFSGWIDESYPSGLCEEAYVRRRVGKVAEEVGEAFEAVGALFGDNARKPHAPADREALRDELLDVATAALGVVAALDGADPVTLLTEHVDRVRSRWLREVRSS